MLCDCPYCGQRQVDMPEYKLLDDRQVFVFAGGIISLSPTETVILRALIDAGDKGYDRERLLMKVYQECRHYDDPPSDRSFIIACAHLRKKLNLAEAPVTISRSRPHQPMVFLERTSRPTYRTSNAFRGKIRRIHRT